MNQIIKVIEEKGIKQTCLAEKLAKIGYVLNRQQARLEVLHEIDTILNVDVRKLIICN